MELKASYYIKAVKRVREMLRTFPSIKESLSIRERQRMTRDLAEYLQRKHEDEQKHYLEDDVLTRETYCKHCVNHRYYNKQVICEARGTTVSPFRKGFCKYFHEGYKA